MKKLLLFLSLVVLSARAIEVRPVDDSSAFCDKTDCIVSYKYMENLSRTGAAQQAIIDGLTLENRDLKIKLSRGEFIPYEIPSKEWSLRISQELRFVNADLIKRLTILEHQCLNKPYPFFLQ